MGFYGRSWQEKPSINTLLIIITGDIMNVERQRTPAKGDNTMKISTKMIAKEKVALSKGWYIASSPIGTFEVMIKNDNGDVVWQKDFGAYEPRCEFLNSFNNGSSSFDGRWWE